MCLSVTLDTNLFYDKAENREGVQWFDTIVSLAKEEKVQLWCTPTTDLEDRSGAAIGIVLRLMREGVLREAQSVGTRREYIPGTPNPHPEDVTACQELLQVMWPEKLWRGAGRNKKNDVRHLLAHRLNDFDIFITGDGEILKKRRLLKERFGITVMAPNELLQKLEM